VCNIAHNLYANEAYSFTSFNLSLPHSHDDDSLSFGIIIDDDSFGDDTNIFHDCPSFLIIPTSPFPEPIYGDGPSFDDDLFSYDLLTAIPSITVPDALTTSTDDDLADLLNLVIEAL
jgi:hypothetical protein